MTPISMVSKPYKVGYDPYHHGDGNRLLNGDAHPSRATRKLIILGVIFPRGTGTILVGCHVHGMWRLKLYEVFAFYSWC